MRNTTLLLATLVVAGGFASPSYAADTMARNLAAPCASCHGTDGKSVGGNEKLAGMPRDQLITKMSEFKSGMKPATIMHQLSKGYTDEQIAQIASYYAAQK